MGRPGCCSPTGMGDKHETCWQEESEPLAQAALAGLSGALRVTQRGWQGLAWAEGSSSEPKG